MVRTVQTLLHSQMACTEMQASARTCGGQHDPKCGLKSSQVKSVYFHHPSQGNSTNYYLILGLRDKAAPPTSQQMKRVKNLATPSSIFIFIFFFIHRRALLSANQRHDRPIGRIFPEHLERSFLEPNIASTNTSN